jgi:hypothetical protein
MLLASQDEHGRWGRRVLSARSFNWRAEKQGNSWTAALPTLLLLSYFGIDPSAELARRSGGATGMDVSLRFISKPEVIQLMVDGISNEAVIQPYSGPGWKRAVQGTPHETDSYVRLQRMVCVFSII